MVDKRKVNNNPPTAGNNLNTLEIKAIEAVSDETAKARAAYDPAVRSLVASRLYTKNMMGEHGLTECLEALTTQVNKIQSGNMQEAEKTLIAQANTLDAIFNELARRAAHNMGEYLNTTETYLRLALKAQSQCRATLETLAAIKNPPVVYARQANVTTGPQQVNNSIVASRVREIETGETQLTGGYHELLPDTGTSGNASRVNPPLEALAEIYRTKDPRG